MDDLKKLASLKNLSIINILSNTMHIMNLFIDTPATEAGGATLKNEVLILLDVLSIKKFNKEEVTPEEIKAAADEKKERLRKIEEEKEAERQAKEKAEAEVREKEEAERKAKEEAEAKEREEARIKAEEEVLAKKAKAESEAKENKKQEETEEKEEEEAE